MRIPSKSLSLILCLFGPLLASSCQNDGTISTTATSATTSQTDSSATSTAATTTINHLMGTAPAVLSTAGATTAVAKKSLVQVVFAGGMCQVLAASRPARTVFLAGANHKVNLELPLDIDPKQVENAIGIKPVLVGSSHLIAGLKGMAFRVVASGTSSELQPTLTTTPDFDLLVPHLKAVTGTADTDLDVANVFSELPAAKFTGFFELGGGILNASPFCMRAKFVPDTERLGERPFAKTVTLSGTTDTPPLLQVKKAAGKWEDIAFTKNDIVRIAFTNEPEPIDNQTHFMLHQAILNTTVNPFPDVPGGTVVSFCSNSGSVPGCENSQWP